MSLAGISIARVGAARARKKRAVSRTTSHGHLQHLQLTMDRRELEDQALQVYDESTEAYDLMHAVEEDDVEGIEAAIEAGAPLNARLRDSDFPGQTPLVCAVRLAKTSSFKMLVQLGADPFIPDDKHRDAWYYCAFGRNLKDGEHKAFIELLFENWTIDGKVMLLAMHSQHTGVRLAALQALPVEITSRDSNNHCRLRLQNLGSLDDICSRSRLRFPDGSCSRKGLTPFQKMVESGAVESVAQPAVLALMRVKWLSFARICFLVDIFTYLMTLVSISVVALLYPFNTSPWTGVKADGGGFLSSIRGVFGKKKQKIKKPIKEDMETGIRHKGWYLQDPKLPITTFAVAVADIDLLRPLMTSEDGESVLELQLQRLFLMLARVHKSYKFVFILSSETNSSIVSEGYWSDGVAEVRRYNVLDHAMSALPHCNPGLPSLPDIAYSLIRAQLESMYLEDLAEEAAKKGPGSHTGNLVFLNLFSIVGGDISHAFLPEEKLYTAGIPVSSDGTTIPPMVTWYVFKDGIQQTSLLLKALQKNIRSEIIADCTTAADAAPAGKGMLYEHLLQQAMECLAAGWNTGAGVRHTCGEWAAAKPAEQEKLPIKMLPCQVFGADLASTKKGYKAHEAKHSCQYQYASSVVAQLAPKDRRFAPSALKRMFCMYTDYCDGSLKGTGYNLRHGDRSKVAFKG